MIHITCWNLMGMVLEVCKGMKAPYYATIFRRIQSLDI